MSKDNIIIFIEGDTEITFYKNLIKYIEEKYKLKRINYKITIKNVKGIGNYQKKALGIFKRKILPTCEKGAIYVFLTHDTDIFEHNKKPPISWDEVEKNFRGENSINKVFRIKAKKSIEDWFLIDIDGILKYLKLKKVKKNSNNGTKYLMELFKQGNKVYLKGSKMDPFINCLNIDVIYQGIKSEIKVLEDILKKY